MTTPEKETSRRESRIKAWLGPLLMALFLLIAFLIVQLTVSASMAMIRGYLEGTFGTTGVPR